MRPRPPVIVIGAGRAGVGMARGLKGAGYTVPAIVTRRASDAATASRWFGRGTGTTNLRGAVTRARIILICVPDREIAGVVRQLVSLPAPLLRGRFVFHTSGVATGARLARLRRRGASTGCVHPLVSFPPPGSEPCHLRGAAFAIDGDVRALRAARTLVKSLGGVRIRVAPKDRPAYHLVASLLANGLVALIDDGFGLARRRLKMTDATVRAVFIPLLATVLANVARSGARDALTGPVVRGDVETVGRLLQQLRKEDPRLADLYRLLARSALRMARETERLDGPAAAEVERVGEEAATERGSGVRTASGSTPTWRGCSSVGGARQPRTAQTGTKGREGPMAGSM